MGLVASSNAIRLKSVGIYVKASIDPPVWFLGRIKPMYAHRLRLRMSPRSLIFRVLNWIGWECAGTRIFGVKEGDGVITAFVVHAGST